ncbi:acylphosphatase [Kordiimonas sediminis]|uniref:acylphosphatase n=1 Tax=Kordiimonas sediminis TaxID=1735581 RepID=A0A919E8X2_9PROT|nr:acylphosphatase [Kordiimonas sediminis]GHF24656.1 acylphosphatase [Kordiimonas sediminis]
MTTTAVKVRIYGKVQGVWYRAWTEQQANAAGVYGWVRNRLDGTVEALFVGSSAAVDGMIAACHQGPEHAKVDRIETVEAQGIAPKRFEVKPTV